MPIFEKKIGSSEKEEREREIKPSDTRTFEIWIGNKKQNLKMIIKASSPALSIDGWTLAA